MSDSDQRRAGLLAERRDQHAQALAAAEHAGGDAARDGAGHASRRSVRARTRAGDGTFPIGGGEMGDRIRAFDWSATLLGPIEHWPDCLRSALDMVLRSPMPMSIHWGERGILFYNDAMAPMMGVHHPHVLGTSSLDAWPAHSKWLEGLLRQVLAGETVSLHNQRLEVRRSGMREQAWFDIDCSPIVDEDGRPRGMLQIALDTTEQVAALGQRERLEKELRESEARQRFVLAFNDRVRRLGDPQMLMSEAVAALGAQMGVDRCGYAEVRSDMQQVDVLAEWTDQRQVSAVGVQSLADSSAAVRSTFLAGKTLVVRDAANDARESVRSRATKYLAWDARALVGAPLIHNGRWVALLYVAAAKPRAWSSAEVGLLEEMAARIWEAVQRARAETALRDNEARLLGLFTAVPSAVFVCDRQAVIQDYNARAVELWGRAPIRGVDKRGSVHLWFPDGTELPPDFTQVEEVLRTGIARHRLEMIIGRPDGSRIPVEVDFSPLKDARGEVTGAVAAFNDISERKRREAHLALLADIAEATARCESEAELMQAVSGRVGKHLDLHCCCLISVDEAHENAVVDQVWYEGEIPKLPRRAPLSQFVIPGFNEEARAGKPIVVDDCHADPRTDGDAYARYEVGAYVSVPWLQKGSWRGLLAFCDDAPRAWRQDEIELLREIAHRVLPRFERVRVQGALRASQWQLSAQVSDLERLQALGTRLMKQDDLEAVLREVMQAARQLLDADRSSVQVVENGRLRRVDSSGLPPEFGERFHVVRESDITTCAAALRTRERVVVEDFATDPRFTDMAEVFAKIGVRAGISTPLLAEDGSVLAMFSLYFDQPWQPDHWALRMLDLYAQQAVVQIERTHRNEDAALLAAIVTSSRDAIISKDLGGIITSWNQGAEWLFGYTAEEMIGKPITMLAPPGRTNEESELAARIRVGQVVDHFETVRQRKDGMLLDVSLTIAPIRDAQGTIVGASKIARDITQRVRTERELAASEARFRQMIDALPMPVYTTDPQGRIAHFNPASIEFAGRTPKLGSDQWSIADKLYRADGSSLPHEQAPMAIALKQDLAIYGGIEVIAERPDGTRRWFTPYPSPLHDAQGQLIGGINMLVDITGRKRDEQALQAAHARTESMRRLYEAILDHTPDLAYMFDLDHRFMYANAILLKMWGKTWDEAIGKTCLELDYPEWTAAKLDREIDQVIETRLPVRSQVPFTGTFGPRVYDYVFVPVIGPHGEVEAVAGTTRDITDQQDIERNLRANEERKSFLLALGDAIRAETNPQDVQRIACEALGRYFGCERVYFTEIKEDEGYALVRSDYHRDGQSSAAGRYELAGMQDFIGGLRSGAPVVIDDVANAPLPDSLRAMLEPLGIRSAAAALLVREGTLSWALIAAYSSAREWAPGQVSLLTEVAERTWDAVQRAQAIAALDEAREQAEQQARMFQSTLSSVLDMVFRYTPEGRIVYANQALADLWGIPAGQATGKSMAELGYAPETEQHVLRDLAKVVETGAPLKNEAAYTNPAGVAGYFTYKLAPIFDSAGKVVQIAGTALDITDRKRTELLLAEQKSLLELIATGCELPKCLKEVTASVARLDAHTRAAVLLASDDRRSFQDVYAVRIPETFANGIRGAPINELAIGTCGTVVFEGRPVVCGDVANDEHWSLEWRDLCLAHGIRAGYSTPIFDPHGNSIGSFFLAFDHVGEPDGWHRRIAEFGAHVASIAIANSRAEAAVRESEEELTQELADTRLLQGVSTELLSETDPDALYARIVDAASALMRSDFASLQMYHPEVGSGGELRLLAHRGFDGQAEQVWTRLAPDSGSVCALSLQSGKRIIIKDVRDCAASLDMDTIDAFEHLGIRAVQTTPLFARNGKLVGMLSTHWSEPHEPSARRMGLLEVLGRQAADLIEGRRSEQKLLELNNFLERRVIERTAELVESERRVREMASQLTMAEHAERRRISQILHDDLQQQLHSIQMKLASARGSLGRGDEARTLKHLNDAEQWSGEGVETARRLTVDLSPPILKSEGLAEALDWLVTQMREMHGLHVSIGGDRDLQMQDDAKRVLIYQVVRELLFNIVKHAGVDRARVELHRHEEVLDVCVLDEGKGFDPEQLRKPRPRSAGGFGLTSAQERLHLLGGGIEVDSAPGVGTSIVLHVPIRVNDSEASSRMDEQDSNTQDLFG